MKALRIHVERIVRPIRASVRRKNKMREELLAHLAAAFEEERTLASSDDEALGRAKQRLGDPHTLRDELQASVPWIERVGFVRLPLREPEAYGKHERFGWRGSARFATEVAALVVILYPVYKAANLAVEPEAGFWVRLIEKLPLLCVFLGCVWVAFFVTYLLFDLVGARNAMSPWNKTPSFVKACLSVSSVILAAGLFLVMAVAFAETALWGKTPHLIAEGLIEDAQSIPYWIWLAGLCGLLGGMTVAKHRERRQYEKWGCLDVENNTGIESR